MGIKEKIEEIMKPAKSAMAFIDYNEGVVIGSSFGQLIAIIEKQHDDIKTLENTTKQCDECDGKGVQLDWGDMKFWECESCGGTGESEEGN